MEILDKALKLISKYGISLHKFGPYLSYIDEKIGICLELKDNKYGFLMRNYTFDNINEFEKFIKRYSYYKNEMKGDTTVILNDYISLSPEIIYGFEKKELLQNVLVHWLPKQN